MACVAWTTVVVAAVTVGTEEIENFRIVAPIVWGPIELFGC